MTVLVVFAHPLQESFNHAVFDTVLRVVRSHKPGADVVDLYRRAPASVTATADPDEIVDTVVLVYPTWWTAQPALLWQWLLDRDASTWTGVNRVVCVTTHGGKRVAAVLAGPGRSFRTSLPPARRCRPSDGAVLDSGLRPRRFGRE